MNNHRYKIKYDNLSNKINWKVGDILIYKNTNEKVELVKIHLDDIIPYYTVKMPDNREKQTIGNKLKKIE